MMYLTIDKVELPEKLELEDKWVLSKLNTLVKEVTDNLEAYELGVASAKVYDFIWDTYCDWYIELTKSRMQGEDEQAKVNAQNVLCYVLINMLKLLHPFMPFITEAIYQALPHDEGDAFLMTSSWPVYDEALRFPAEEAAMEKVMDAIRAIRARRAEMNVAPGRKVKLVIATEERDVFAAGEPFFLRLASASEVEIVREAPSPEGMVSVVTHAARLFMPLRELVDLEQERARIAREKEKAEKGLAIIEKKLSNESFVAKAPEAVVNAEREKAEKLRALMAQLDQSLAALG